MASRPTAPSDRKPWLTMLHGFTQDDRVFDRQKAHFEHRYNVACLTLPGHGTRGPTADDSYSIQDYGRDVLRQLDGAGIQTTHFWGTHTGAAVGLLLALEQPRRVSTLILEGAVVPGFDMPLVAARIERARSVARSRGVAASMADWFENAEYFQAIRTHPEAFRAAEHRQIVMAFQGRPLLAEIPPGAGRSIVDRIARIGCPVLLYNGSEDADDFKRCATFLQRNLPNVQRVELDGLGGFPAWESPERVNPVVDRFLAERT